MALGAPSLGCVPRGRLQARAVWAGGFRPACGLGGLASSVRADRLCFVGRRVCGCCRYRLLLLLLRSCSSASGSAFLRSVGLVPVSMPSAASASSVWSACRFRQRHCRRVLFCRSVGSRLLLLSSAVPAASAMLCVVGLSVPWLGLFTVLCGRWVWCCCRCHPICFIHLCRCCGRAMSLDLRSVGPVLLSLASAASVASVLLRVVRLSVLRSGFSPFSLVGGSGAVVSAVCCFDVVCFGWGRSAPSSGLWGGGPIGFAGGGRLVGVGVRPSGWAASLVSVDLRGVCSPHIAGGGAGRWVTGRSGGRAD